MNKRYRRVLAVILCITLIFGIDNISGYRIIGRFFGNAIVTSAKNFKSEVEDATEAITKKSKKFGQGNTKEEESSKNEQDTIIEDDMLDTSVDELIDETLDIQNIIEGTTENVIEETTEETTEEVAEETTQDVESPEAVIDNEIQTGSFSASYFAGEEQLTQATEVVAGGTYLIKSMADWEKLQTLSQTNTLENMTFIVYKRDSKYDDWTLTNYQIGNEQYPFSGTLYSYYASCTIKTNKNIFKYLSSKAHIGYKTNSGFRTLVLSYTAAVPAGLAENLILEEEGCDVNIGSATASNYYVKILTGTVSTSTDVAGGLFAHVYVKNNAVSDEDGKYKLTIAGNTVDLTGITNKAVTGRTAGGVIGEIHGDIDVYIQELPTLLTTVTSNYSTPTINGAARFSAAGGVIGYAGQGVNITFVNPSKIEIGTNVTTSNVSSYGYCVGGFIGFLDGGSLVFSNGENGTTKSAGILRTGNTQASRFAGGFIGYASNSTVVVFDYTQKVDTYIYESGSGNATNEFCAGTVIGKYFNELDNKKLDLSFIKSTNKKSGTPSNIRISSPNTAHAKTGGLAGSIDAGKASVKLHDINTGANTNSTTADGGDNCLYVGLASYNNAKTNAQTLTYTGGLVGNLAGEDITVENVIFNYVYYATSSTDGNTLGGGYVGDIAANVGFVNNVTKKSKIVVKDVKVANNFIRRVQSFHGGLFGYVTDSVISLQGTVDLSKVPYETIDIRTAASDTYNYSGQDTGNTKKDVMLAIFRQRGFVAGYAKSSLIYVDTDCNYIRPITYLEDGRIAEYDSDDIHFTNITRGSEDYYKYVIDDIGNAGAVLKNKENVLNIANEFDNIVTGTIEKDGTGAYVIDSLGDALRLSAVCTAIDSTGYSIYGKNVFTNADSSIMSIADILSKHYKLTVDLKLEDAGIHGFVNNSNLQYPFSGIFEGVAKADGTYPTITLHFVSKQKYGGLFPYVTNATFKNLNFKGNVNYLGATDNKTISSAYEGIGAAGSIAAQALGNITIENVNIYTGIKMSLNYYTMWDNGNSHMYGGVFGYYISGNNTNKLVIKDCIIDPKFTVVRGNTYAGGIVGWVYANASNIADISVSGCTLSTDITSNSALNYWDGYTYHGRNAGMFATISYDFANVNTINDTRYRPATTSNATYAKIDITDLVIDESHFDYTEVHKRTNYYIRSVGGFLGYSWNNVDVNIHGSEDGTKKGIIVKNSSMITRGVVGGLVSYAAGRFKLSDIDIQSLTMTDILNTNGGHATYCGLILGNGQEAYVELDNSTYNIATDGNVQVNDYLTFDEIVGLNVRLRQASDGVEYIYSPNVIVNTSYSGCGILNIIKDDFKDFNDSTYCSYQNKIITTKNKYTRYYYNLFVGDSEEWNIPLNGQIDNEKRWMTYSVACYANANIARFINEHINSGNSGINNIASIKVTADLDFNGYSLYPTPSSKTIDFDNHTITLYGSDVYNAEVNMNTSGKSIIERNNQEQTSQHYMMHAALFNSLTSGCNISNVVLTGTVANIGADTGALICKNLSGGATIRNVTMDNLKVNNYTGGGEALLIGKIGQNPYGDNSTTNVTIDKIYTKNYDNLSPVASALIGTVGTTTATNVIVNFTNLQLEDEKLADKVTGRVFKFASLIYDYEYTTDSVNNFCYLAYTFSRADVYSTPANVTYGDEIKNGVHYSDQDRVVGDLLDTAITDAIAGKYIPYVYMQRNIYVNPKNGDITKGCGTYEDPYIIDNVKQLLTLYLYLTGNTSYQTIFKGVQIRDEHNEVISDSAWKIAPVGGGTADKSECSNNSTGETTHTLECYSTGNVNFPTRTELSRAYYKISADLNLENASDMNDSYVAGEFAGLGSDLYPFAGVIVGTKDETTNYTITLPKQAVTLVKSGSKYVQSQITQSSFGFIQIMSGGVIKDLNITTSGFDEGEYYNINKTAGGAVATIVGGDNIIDNVSVSVNFNIYTYTTTDNAQTIRGIGGLVGTVENGSLILRNMQKQGILQNCSFENFNVNKATVIAGIIEQAAAAANNTVDWSSYDYNYSGCYGETVGLVVGNVYDGYVIYEGYNKESGEEPYILDRGELKLSNKYLDKYPAVNNTQIINGNKLDSTSGDGGIIVTSTALGYDAHISSAEELLAMSLALNSDSLSVYYCEGKDHNTGYGYENICRKAKYDNVGKPGAKDNADRNFAVNYDDNKKIDVGYLYPYMCYKYFNYTAMSAAGATAPIDASYIANNYEGYKNTLSQVTTIEKVSNVNYTRNQIVGNFNKTREETADKTTTYYLDREAGDVVKNYDLRNYGISFRGIGGIYTYEFSDFRGNFDGQGNNVMFNITRAGDSKVAQFKNDKRIPKYTGFFNQLIYNQKLNTTNPLMEQREIKNINIKNSTVYNPFIFDEIRVTSDNGYINTYGIEVPATGMVVGKLRGPWKFENINISRDEAITAVDKNGDALLYDVSGYKEVGGMIGRVANGQSVNTYGTEVWMNDNYPLSGDLDMINCDITGTDDYNYGVVELGSTDFWTAYATHRYVNIGGYIGGIGTNVEPGKQNWTYVYGDVDIVGCDYDYVTVEKKGTGNIGGMIGLAGVRWNCTDYGNSGWSAIGTITIDGQVKEGDIVTKNKGNVSNLKIISTEITDNYSSGGMIGRIESPRDFYGGVLSIKNYEIKNIDVDKDLSTLATNNSAHYDYQGVGGIIGYSRTYEVNIENIKFSVTDGHRNTVGTVNRRRATGGLIGRMEATGNTGGNYSQYRVDNFVNINNVDMNCVDVNSYMHVGGFVGLTGITQLVVGLDDSKNEVKNCNIHCVAGEGAGGIVGTIKRSTTMNAVADNHKFTNVYVIDSTVYNDTYGAGGIVGDITNNQNSKNTYTFKNAYVYSTDGDSTIIQGADYGGGIVGYTGNGASDGNRYVYLVFDGYIGVGDYINTGTGTWNGANNTGANLRGRFAGGLMAYYYSNYAEAYPADIMIANNRIYAYRDVNNTNKVYTYSGGLFGTRKVAASTNLTFNKTTVKNNVIFNAGGNYVSRDRTWGSVASGGVIGYYYGYDNSNMYMPYLTLENNSIGYYDVGPTVSGRTSTNTEKTKMGTDWLTEDLDSKDIRLFDATNTILEYKSWDEITDLSDSTIGTYAVAFGKYMGRYDFASQKANVYILAPDVKYDDTVGSIPVIDVANHTYTDTTNQSTVKYQEGSPYVYRKNVHITYVQEPGTTYKNIDVEDGSRKPTNIDSTLLTENQTDYKFGEYNDYVLKYQNLNNGVSEDDYKTKNFNYINSYKLNMYMPYNDETEKYTVCSGDKSYYNLTYNIFKEDGVTPDNVFNGVPTLVIDGLDPQAVADSAAAVLTNVGGVNSDNLVNSLRSANYTGLNNYWKITVNNAYIDVDGTIKPIISTDPKFAEHKSSSIVVSNSNRLNLAQSLYDEYVDIDAGRLYTISLLTYTYTCPDAEGNNNVKSIYIPIYVKEKVSIDSYIRILSNEEYSLNTAQKEGYKDEVTVSHDSTYTIYAEFVYDNIRNKPSFINDVAHKTLIYDANVPVINPGTKFTMIDFQTGLSYYYTSDGASELVYTETGMFDYEGIPFSWFKDKDGNSFEQRCIGTSSDPDYKGIASSLTFNSYKSIGYKVGGNIFNGVNTYTDTNYGIGVERYFIVVEPADIENNINFMLNVKTNIKDINNKDVDEFANKNSRGEAKGIEVTCIPGPSIGFGGIDDDGVGTEGITYIKGKISTEETVSIDANIEVKLNDTISPYWDEKDSGNTIDSANTNKYLEVAVTLIDGDNNVVPWPAGTNISINNSAMQLLENNLIIYTYKDSEKQFLMNDVVKDITGECFYYDIAKDHDDPNMKWIYVDEEGNYFYYVGFDPVMGSWQIEYLEEDIDEEYISFSNQLNVTLDFSVADIDEYNGQNYTVMLKLYRSDDPDYPNEGTTKSYGNTKRQYADNITGESIKELAAAVSADDLLDLGINTYNNVVTKQHIPFTNKLDFSDLIKNSTKQMDIEELAQSKYLVTYRLYKKVAKTGTGEDDDLDALNNEIIKSTLDNAVSYDYVLMEWDDSPFTLYDENGDKLNQTEITVNTDQVQKVIQTTKYFNEDQIENGTDGTQYVAQWGLNLEADTSNLGNDELTNYMVRVTYLPFDKDTDTPATDEEVELYDYFVFTVAKLKTDI